jgi:hypothetical protein
VSLAARTRTASALLAAACAVPDPLTAAPDDCVPLPPEGLIVGSITCAAWRISGGEGTYDDTLIATPHYRAVVRHPIASVGQAGLGGGTLVDAAAWGRSDLVHEIVPLVDGGWLEVDSFRLRPDGVTVEGVVRSLPSRPLVSEGQRRSVAWTVVEDGRWLRAIGADGFLLHPDEATRWVDGWLVGGQSVLGHRGSVLRDEGGRIEIAGTDALLFSSTSEAWGLRGVATQTIAGTAADADEIEVLRDDTLVALLPVVNGQFAGQVPADATRVRATAAARAPSADASPSEGLALAVGGSGRVQVVPAWDTGARPITARWVFDDGRTGEDVLAPDGGTLSLGAGRATITLGAGPTRPTRTLVLRLGPDETPRLGVDLRATWDPRSTVPVNLAWPASRAASVRDTATGRTRAALAAGYVYTVQTADDDVASVSQWLNDVPWTRTAAGVTLTHPSGWAIAGWPARADGRRAAHGAPRASVLRPTDASAALSDLGVTHRRANLAWLTATEDDAGEEPYPDRVALSHPGDAPFTAWQPWFEALNDYRFLLPDGPTTWLQVDDPVAPTPTALERALTYGTLSTGDGAWIWMTVDGAPPGSVLSSLQDASSPDTGAGGDTDGSPTPGRRVTVDVHRLRPGVDTLWLWSAQGPLGQVPIDQEDVSLSLELPETPWVIGVATSSRTSDWAVTAPIFTAPDRRRPTGAPDDALPPG